VKCREKAAVFSTVGSAAQFCCERPAKANSISAAGAKEAWMDGMDAGREGGMEEEPAAVWTDASAACWMAGSVGCPYSLDWPWNELAAAAAASAKSSDALSPGRAQSRLALGSMGPGECGGNWPWPAVDKAGRQHNWAIPACGRRFSAIKCWPGTALMR
jgi:hypothetical protein